MDPYVYMIGCLIALLIGLIFSIIAYAKAGDASAKGQDIEKDAEYAMISCIAGIIIAGLGIYEHKK